MGILLVALFMLLVSLLLAGVSLVMKLDGIENYRYVLITSAMIFSASATLITWFILGFR